ncbi:MAG: viroplasmin family protein [Leadbetterella sp.]
MAKSPKFYAVWNGRTKGVFDTWDECKKQIDGFEGAQYKSFETKKIAEDALKKPYYAAINPKPTEKKSLFKSPYPNEPAIVVDAAWNTRTLDMEYQGVDLQTKKLLFKQGPFAEGTNNIGEFLAIVHALALLEKKGLDLPVYSDSKTAITWVKKKFANTKVEKTAKNKELIDMISRAETWLKTHNYKNPIRKWETDLWGENLADFGRK